jgi:hypothetical protein
MFNGSLNIVEAMFAQEIVYHKNHLICGCIQIKIVKKAPQNTMWIIFEHFRFIRIVKLIRNEIFMVEIKKKIKQITLTKW